MSELKLCVNCKHYERWGNHECFSHVCTINSKDIIDRVSGRIHFTKAEDCKFSRSIIGRILSKCGPKAVYYKKKEGEGNV